jgi:hypothetical protein
MIDSTFNNTFNTSFYQNEAYKGVQKCTKCKPNKPIHSNCHSHQSQCEYSCNYRGEVSIGDGLGLLLVFGIVYLIIKKYV